MLTLFVLGSIHCSGQQLQFNHQLKFQDGIYLNFEQLIINQPQFPLSTSMENYLTNHEIQKGIVKTLPRIKKGGKEIKIKIDQIWAICQNGIPMRVVARSIHYNPTPSSVGYTEPLYFLERLSIIGHISYYQSMIDQNPRSNKTPGYIIKYSEPLLSIKLSVKSLSEFIRDDENLYERFMSDKKRKKNLLVYLSEYNRRNPVMIKEE